MTDEQAEIQILKMQLAAAHRFIDELVAGRGRVAPLVVIPTKPFYPEKAYPELTPVAWQETLNLRDAAKYLKIHRTTLAGLVRRGAIIGERVGTRWQVHRETLDRWLSPRKKERVA